jgi:hypothetical protein
MSDGFQPDTGYISVYSMILNPSGDLLAGTGAGIFRRRDGAAVWEPSGLGASTVRSLAMSAGGTIYAVTGAQGVFSSADGGSSWTARGLVRPDLQCIAVSDGGRIFVGASGGVFISTDGGGAWTQKVFTYGHVQSLLFNGPFNVFAGSSSGLFVSADAGQTWSDAGVGSSFVSSLMYDAQHAMIAAVYKGGVLKTAEIITAVPEPPGIPPGPFLAQNFPNPFNPATTIAYAVPVRSRVTLRVYDVLGRISETLVSDEVPPGEHRIVWDGGGKPSGVYFAAITVEPAGTDAALSPGAAWTTVRKMLLMR